MSSGDSGNLVLTGFMGTGKTSVAKAVAQRSHRRFIDMDTEIETRTGRSIPQIFAEDGEELSAKSSRLCVRNLSQRRGLVISTGGGALLNETSRAQMLNSGTVILLSCDVDEILHRVKSGIDGDRPLLDVADPRAEIERLLSERQEAYNAIPWHINTTKRTTEDIADQAMKLASTISLSVVFPGGCYTIHVGAGLLHQLAGALPAAGVPNGGRVAVVSNPVVAPLYLDTVLEGLRSEGYQPFACLIPDGEENKTLASISLLYEQFLDGGLDRSGSVLSVGGGVTGDAAGFAASSYMRGVPFIQIPTTLLAMVDASIGGKTGVDLPQGKNLVGAFKQPALVLIDPSVLATLREEEMRSGLAEVIKHGIIADPALFSVLESGNRELSYWWGEDGAYQIARALQVKRVIVEEDPFERGRRAVLNLGHTIGHAIEMMSGYELRHGEAVAIGMVGAAEIAHALGRGDGALSKRIRETLDRWGLPIACPPYPVNQIWEAMSHDKKRQGSGLRWILPRDIGEVDIVENVAPSVVKAVLRNIGARSD